jgi:hypothetical protein
MIEFELEPELESVEEFEFELDPKFKLVEDLEPDSIVELEI